MTSQQFADYQFLLLKRKEFEQILLNIRKISIQVPHINGSTSPFLYERKEKLESYFEDILSLFDSKLLEI